MERNKEIKINIKDYLIPVDPTKTNEGQTAPSKPTDR